MKINIEEIKKLRAETGAGVADCREALLETGGYEAAREWLRKKGMERAAKKAEREVKAGAVFSYVHHNQAMGSLVTVASETDFVAKNSEFQKLGHELAMQATASGAGSVQNLLEGQYIRDPSRKVAELVKELSGKLGENIQVVDVVGTAIRK